MDGEDVIEDLSEDAALDAFEKKEMEENNEAIKPKSEGGVADSMSGRKVPSIFTDDDEFEGVGDYAEEYTDKDGNHIRKEVHSGDGWKSIEISSSGGGAGMVGMPGMGGGPDIMGDLIA